jgi:hypothetical protein
MALRQAIDQDDSVAKSARYAVDSEMALVHPAMLHQQRNDASGVVDRFGLTGSRASYSNRDRVSQLNNTADERAQIGCFYCSPLWASSAQLELS